MGEAFGWGNVPHITWQPELLKEGDEALKYAVDPVHCSENKGEMLVRTVAPQGPQGQDQAHSPAAPEPKHTPHKQSPNMQFQANVNNSAVVITRKTSHTL